MIPGGFSPTDRPPTEHGMHAIPEELREEARKSGNRSAWIALAVIVLVVIAMIVLLSSMPDVS